MDRSINGNEADPQRRAAPTIPAPPVGLVRRDRLSALLDSAPSGALVLVSAPAGWGKTTAVAEWARRARVAVAWAESDEADTGADFWNRIQEALALTLGTGSETAEPVAARAGHAARAHMARGALRPLERVEDDVALVLEDFDVLGSDGIHAGVNHLLEHLPPNLLLVIVTRSDPVLVLHKARASGRVREIRADDLAFTPYEARRLLEANQLALSNRDVDRLCARMEGWATGLRLSLTPLAHATDSSQVVDTLVGNSSSIAGYLVEQVLNQLKPEDRDLLLRLSVADRFNLELAETLTGREDCAVRLTRMASAGGFITTDPGHPFPYRFHALFRTLLRNELRYDDARHARALSAIAARWYRAADLIPSAMDCALTAQDWDLAGDVLIDVASVALAEGDPAIVARYLDGFSSTSMDATDVRVTLAGILLTLFRGDHEATARRLERCRPDVERLAGASGTRAELFRRLLLSGVSFFRGQADEIFAALGPEEDFIAVGGSSRQPSSGDTARRAASLMNRAYALLAAGRLAASKAAADAALRLSDHQMSRVEFHGRQLHALAAICSGELELALQKCQSALTLISALPDSRTFDSAVVDAVCSWIHLERGDYQAARNQSIQPGEARSTSDHLPVATQLVQLIHGRVDSLTVGDPTIALEAARPLGEGAATKPARPYVLELARLVMVTNSLLRLGRHGEAIAAIEESPEGENTTLAHAVVRARALLYDPATVQPDGLDEVRAVVRSVEDETIGSAAYAGWRLRLLLTAAVLEFQQLEKDRASHLLHLTLPATETDGWRLPFLELGDTLLPLLLHDRGRINAHADILNQLVHLLGPASRQAAGALVVALSEREAEILQLLPAAYNQDEIAEVLFISKNTLKTHLRAIYRKLGVESRRQAVIRAEELQLL